MFEVAFSPDGRREASASDDGTVRVWDLTRHNPIVVLVGHDALTAEERRTFVVGDSG